MKAKNFLVNTNEYPHVEGTSVFHQNKIVNKIEKKLK